MFVHSLLPPTIYSKRGRIGSREKDHKTLYNVKRYIDTVSVTTFCVSNLYTVLVHISQNSSCKCGLKILCLTCMQNEINVGKVL